MPLKQRRKQEPRTQNCFWPARFIARDSHSKTSATPNGAMTAVEEAGRIYQSVGDRYGLASTLEVTGQVLFDRGDYPGALGKFNDELAIAREVGNRKAEASALNNMALVLGQQGDAEQARKMYEKALPIFREVSDKTNYAMTLINIAGITKDEGDLAGAKKTYDQALTLGREINDQNGIATATHRYWHGAGCARRFRCGEENAGAGRCARSCKRTIQSLQRQTDRPWRCAATPR